MDEPDANRILNNMEHIHGHDAMVEGVRNPSLRNQLLDKYFYGTNLHKPDVSKRATLDDYSIMQRNENDWGFVQRQDKLHHATLKQRKVIATEWNKKYENET